MTRSLVEEPLTGGQNLLIGLRTWSTAMGLENQAKRTNGISGLGPDEYAAQVRERYASGQTPWDTGVPSPELIRVIEQGDFEGKTVLEFGCGSGTNSIELARRGFSVTAVDLVELPIQRAKEKAQRAGVRIDFRVGDFTRIDLGGPYDCLFDSSVYDGIRNRDLSGFLRALQNVSRPGTRWLSLAGSAREPTSAGPPVVREEEFRSELGGLFRFLEVREFRFDIGPNFQPLAWSILMERK